MDIPTDDGTPLHAIDDGVVKLAGYHRDYSDGVIQVSDNGISMYVKIYNSTEFNYCLATRVFNRFNTKAGMKIVTSSSILTTYT